MFDRVLRTEADDYTDEAIAEAYIDYPSVPSGFSRNTLVIGSKGAGKTFLLRHRKSSTHQRAIHLKLTSVLGPIARNAGIGGRTETFRAALENQIQSKTMALVAVNIVVGCSRDRPNEQLPELAIMNSLLPKEHFKFGPATPDAWLRTAKQVANIDLDDWGKRVTELEEVRSFFIELNSHYGEILTLFLDRAEDASYPSVQMLLNLLDQVVPVLTVIAARPGLAQIIPRAIDPSLIAGDHFDVLHLGLDPYGDRWQQFSSKVVASTFRTFKVEQSSELDLRWTGLLARDSLRQAIKLSEYAYRTPNDNQIDERADLVNEDRQDTLVRVRSMMAAWHPNFKDLVELVKTRSEQDFDANTFSHLLIELEGPDDYISLIGKRKTSAELLLSGLRSEGFFFAPGTKWSAAEVPTTMELNPLLVWDRTRKGWLK